MDVEKYAIKIVRRLVEKGYIAYYAGGWVRDFIMGHPSSDIDIATDAPPEEVIALFPKTIQVGLAFGVVIVVEGGHQYEVSTFRRDIDYEDGRRPKQIAHSTPEEDALRRDFTINGMFYDPLGEEILDYVEGQEDIRRKVIRTIGDPYERFREDRLRMIRAIRFAAKFGFEIEKETLSAISERAETLFPSVAVERVWQEIKKMSEHPGFDRAILDLYRVGLLEVIFPALNEISDKEINKKVSLFPSFPKACPAILYIMELFAELTTEQQLEICRRLKVSNENQNLVEFVHQAKQMILAEKPPADINWVYFFAHSHAELALEVIAARFAPEERHRFLEEQKENRERLKDHIQRKIHNKPLVSSHHLREYGVQPGKEMGQLLQEAEHIAIEKNWSDPDQVLEFLRKSDLWPS